MSMRILFDHQSLCLEGFGGITRYHVELAQALGGLEGVEASWFGGIHRSTLRESEIPCRLAGIRLPWIPRAGYPLQVLSGQILPWLPGGFDVVHQTYVHAFRLPPGAARVVTIHDCIYENFPALFRDSARTISGRKRSLDLADAVICVSRHVRSELLRHYPVDPSLIHVVHHGSTVLPPPQAEPAHPRPYLLFVGKRGGYKDFKVALEAWRDDQTIYGAVDFVAFGGGAFTPEERALVAGHPAAPRLVHWSGDDQRLATAYAQAVAVLIPSRAEGFGLPVLEAMSLGAAVLAADSTSLPEVAGEAALLIPPGDPQAWSTAIRRILRDSDLRSLLIDRGSKRVEEFSWKRCAEQTAEAYEHAVARHRRNDP